jgi:glycine hydroxymethyltransferase
MREGEMRRIGSLIGSAARCDPGTAAGASRLAGVADEVTALVRQFPAYPREKVMA